MNDFLFIFIMFLIVAGGVVISVFLARKSRVDKVQSEEIRNLKTSIDSISGQLKEIRGSIDGTSREMHQQISSFTKGTVQIQEELKRVQEEMKSISSFQEIFKSPKLRGEWGEASLKHILNEYFPKEFYETQHLFSSGEQVDAVLKLPDGRLLPIDAKFSSTNFEKLVEAKSGEEKELFQKKFAQDVKSDIDKIASKYILPSENTVDYALMYIPAEAIFHEIMFNLREENIGDYARKKKIILTSPNTIYLTLRAIVDWFRDTQISRQTKEILRKLSRIQTDAEKLMDDFRKLGVHLRNASSSYDSSENRLSLFTDRVERLTEMEGETKKLKGEDKK